MPHVSLSKIQDQVHHAKLEKVIMVPFGAGNGLFTVNDATRTLKKLRQTFYFHTQLLAGDYETA